MPIELETAASRPFILHGSPIWPCIRSAKVAASSSLGLPRISIRNSSPPRCATRSSGRAKRFSRAAISRSIRSPMWWPSDSLTGLKPSRSMKSIAIRSPVASACWQAWASMPSNISRFGSRVRPSRKERRCSSLSARRSDRRRRASRIERIRPTTSRAIEPSEANRASVVEPIRSACSDPVCAPRPAAPATSCWLATRVAPSTKAAVACQGTVGGWLRSPPRKKAPSAIMQPPQAPDTAAMSDRSCQSTPGCRPSGVEAKGRGRRRRRCRARTRRGRRGRGWRSCR